jgi:quercetin dioxygenase-like cupin family protein
MSLQLGRHGKIAAAGVVAAAVLGAAGTLPTLAAGTGDVARQKAAQHYFVLKGKGQVFDQLKDEAVEVKLSAAQTEGRYTIQDEHWHPGFDVPPHFHKEHAETFYLLDGQYEWTVGAETHLMSAGDLVYIPPNTVHSVHVVGNKDAHVLFIYQPGGYEHYQESEMAYSKEDREKPEIKSKLRRESDFNLADGK